MIVGMLKIKNSPARIDAGVVFVEVAGHLALFDEVDYKRIQYMSLRLHPRTGHVLVGTEHIANVVLQKPSGVIVDHKDCNPLNNRRKNLRVCTATENAWNHRKHQDAALPYKGVAFHRGDQKFHARVTANGVTHHLGSFDNPVEAAKAYNQAARQLHGRFARINQFRTKICTTAD